ncbi:MAG: polymorphic toxin-type HINT domain-containing protein [Planctomycetota bacterium]
MRMIGGLRTLAVLGLVALTTDARAEGTMPAQTADGWRDAATTAALAGDTQGHTEALRAAIDVDPDHAPSRADRGEVRVDGTWMPVDYAAFRASEDERLAEYEKLRSEASDTLTDHKRLARWCERQGLSDEARPHWLMVLREEPRNAEALRGLNAKWRDGRLWDVELAKAADAEDSAARRASRAWDFRIKRLERGRGSDRDHALDAFATSVDEHAARPIERRVEQLAGGTSRLDERRRQIVHAYLEAADDLPQAKVTASLCRIAIEADEDALREAAIKTLVDREPFDVMPLLLGHLESEVESSYEVMPLARGGVAYQHRFKAEGAEVDQQLERNRVVNVPIEGIERLPDISDQVDALWLARKKLVQNQLEMTAEAEATETLVAEHNAAVGKTNQRVFAALERVVERDLGDEPRQWWDYWQRYSGYDVPYERPVERRYENEQRNDYAFLPPPPPRCECFVAGTPVWTKQGKQAIETIERGDLVLARDPDRGGLTYRVVLQRTTREPSAMVEIVAGGETIQATVGHPFWVLGDGWTMAKQLTEGDVLSSIEGPITVESVTEHEDREAFNLVVEGAANYYVGETGVLVHDNTPRRPAVGLVATR